MVDENVPAPPAPSNGNANGNGNGERFFKVSQTTGLAVLALFSGGLFTRMQDLPARMDAQTVEIRALSTTVTGLAGDVREIEKSLSNGNAQVATMQAQLSWVQQRLENVERKLEASGQ